MATNIADDIFVHVRKRFPDIECIRCGSSVGWGIQWFEGILIGKVNENNIRIYIPSAGTSNYNYKVEAGLCTGGHGGITCFNISNPTLYEDILTFIENNIKHVYKEYTIAK